MSLSPTQEAARRRTFAIISHPDAGKTTLTEHLLLAGGAIRAAGAVRARGENRRTRSDWMKIERERGISVSASVMTFDHQGLLFNLLDTPGHEDFSEDTYRTLTAADCAVMVLDAAKGIEPQTLKLFEVCRMRDIPIVTFINKMDREALDPFALLDEIGAKLALDPAPLYWPAGSGNRFKGVIDLGEARFLPYVRHSDDPEDRTPVALNSNAIASLLDAEELEEAKDGAELVQGASKPFDPQSFLEGHMTPVLFGSALRHFGVEELLATLCAYAPPPQDREAERAGAAIAVAARRSGGLRLRVQDPGQHGPQPPRPHRLRQAVLGRVRARHEAEGAEHRPPNERAQPHPVHGRRPRAGGGGLRGRRDRHPQPRRAARGRQPVRDGRAALCRPAQLRARDPAAGCGSRTRSRPSTSSARWKAWRRRG